MLYITLYLWGRKELFIKRHFPFCKPLFTFTNEESQYLTKRVHSIVECSDAYEFYSWQPDTAFAEHKPTLYLIR